MCDTRFQSDTTQMDNLTGFQYQIPSQKLSIGSQMAPAGGAVDNISPLAVDSQSGYDWGKPMSNSSYADQLPAVPVMPSVNDSRPKEPTPCNVVGVQADPIADSSDASGKAGTALSDVPFITGSYIPDDGEKKIEGMTNLPAGLDAQAAQDVLSEYINPEKVDMLIGLQESCDMDIPTGSKVTNCLNGIFNVLNQCDTLKGLVQNQKQLCLQMKSQTAQLQSIAEGNNSATVDKAFAELVNSMEKYCANNSVRLGLTTKIKDSLTVQKPLTINGASLMGTIATMNMTGQAHAEAMRSAMNSPEEIRAAMNNISEQVESEILTTCQGSQENPMNCLYDYVSMNNLTTYYTKFLDMSISNGPKFCQQLKDIISEGSDLISTGAGIVALLTEKVVPCIANMCAAEGAEVAVLDKISNIVQQAEANLQTYPIVETVPEHNSKSGSVVIHPTNGPTTAHTDSDNHVFSLTHILIAAVVVGIIFFVVSKLRGGKKKLRN